jgi:hypothetical protein
LVYKVSCMIQEISKKIKDLRPYLLAWLIGLVAGIYIGHTLYTYLEKDNNRPIIETNKAKSSQLGGVLYPVFASKNGKTYYFPWCAGLSRIKKANIVSFESQDEAINRGFRLAKGCLII